MDAMKRKTACVTGATSGIGAAFANRFARQGYDLILTGRRREKIEALSQTLSQEHYVHVDVMLAELSDAQILGLLAAKLKTTESLEILVNNAGFAKENLFHEEDLATHDSMLKVHNVALMTLCHAVLPNMVSRGRGRIINVSSFTTRKVIRTCLYLLLLLTKQPR